MKYTNQYWTLVNKKTGYFYEVQDKAQVYNSREEARLVKHWYNDYKVEKVNVIVERKSV